MWDGDWFERRGKGDGGGGIAAAAAAVVVVAQSISLLYMNECVGLIKARVVVVWKGYGVVVVVVVKKRGVVVVVVS